MTLFYILLITFASILITNVAFTIIHKKLFKLSFFKNEKRKEWISYGFWVIIGISFLTYFISYRFYNQWVDLHDYLSNPDSYNLTDYSRSIILSKGFLLDMCPFMSLCLSFSFIVDKSKKFSSYLSPFCILGGLITLPFIPYNEPNEPFDANYIFIGTQANPLYFMMHYYLVVFGILAFRRNKNKTWFDIIWLHVVAIVYFSYIIIVSRIYNVQYNVTGTVSNDWMDPIYGSWYGFTEIFKLDFPTSMIVGYSLGYCFITGLWISNKVINNLILNFRKRNSKKVNINS